jgi:hypothetical protein
MPEAGEYIDAGKLPTTEIITKHMGPLAYSQSTSEKGTRIETAGPLTSNQLLLGIAAGAAGFIGPAMKQFLPEDGTLDPNKLLQLAPGGQAAPTAPTAPDPASAPDPAAPAPEPAAPAPPGEPNTPAPEPEPPSAPAPDDSPAPPPSPATPAPAAPPATESAPPADPAPPQAAPELESA